MPINRIAFVVLAMTCVAAAGGGAYLATRHNDATDQSVPGVSAAVALQPGAAAPATVTETETIVDETPTLAETHIQEPAEKPARPSVTAPRTTPRANTSTQRSGRTAASTSASAPRTPTADRPSATESSRVADRTSGSGAQSAPQVAEAQPQPAFGPVAVESRPPEKTFEDLTVAADSVLGLQIDKAVTSEKARVEDKVEARVTRDVTVGEEVAIPAGSRVEGSVTVVDRGGKVKERARLGIRFHTLVLADGTRIPLSTDALYREGSSPTRESTAKIGGAAVGGAILGAIMGGGKGATIGGAVGAAGGTAAVMAGDRNPATLPAGSTVTVRILSPVTVTVEK